MRIRSTLLEDDRQAFKYRALDLVVKGSREDAEKASRLHGIPAEFSKTNPGGTVTLTLRYKTRLDREKWEPKAQAWLKDSRFEGPSGLLPGALLDYDPG